MPASIAAQNAADKDERFQEQYNKILKHLNSSNITFEKVYAHIDALKFTKYYLREMNDTEKGGIYRPSQGETKAQVQKKWNGKVEVVFREPSDVNIGILSEEFFHVGQLQYYPNT